MGWDSITIFSVISGLTLIGMALYPDLEPKEKIMSAVGGILFVGYGFYGASMTSGTFFYSPIVFLIPAFAIFSIGQRIYRSKQAENKD